MNESGEKAAYRRIERLEKRGLVRVVGFVQINTTGRKNKVLCGWHPQLDTLPHELAITDICLALNGNCVRGPKTKKRCDAQITIDGIEYLLEFDTGKMGLQAVERQWTAKYEDSDDTVLIVTVNERRHADLVKLIARIDASMYVTLIEKVLDEPYGAIWTDRDGDAAAIEQPEKQT